MRKKAVNKPISTKDIYKFIEPLHSKEKLILVPHLVYNTLLHTYSGCDNCKQRPNYLTITVHKYLGTWWYISSSTNVVFVSGLFLLSAIYFACPSSFLISILCSSSNFMIFLLLFLSFPPFFVSALYTCFLFLASFVTSCSLSCSLPLYLYTRLSVFLHFYFRFIVSSFCLV